MQVGGALGAATLTSVFFDAARADYAARLASTGSAWTGSARSRAPGARPWASPRARERKILPEGMEHLFEDAFREAFTVGVARVFAVGAVVAVACGCLAWRGLRRAGATATPDRGASPAS